MSVINKPIFLLSCALAISTGLALTACSDITNPVAESTPSIQPQVVSKETKKRPEPVVSTTTTSKRNRRAIQPKVSPVAMQLTSVSDAIPLFEQLDYDRNSCTPGDCSIPRITFNKIDNKWKTTASSLPVSSKKELFFNLMTPLILIANNKIQVERAIVKTTDVNASAFKSIALKYRLITNSAQKLNESMRTKLLQRVDILPASLALAQAAEESGWATSRFAIEGNAFFGQWDYSGNGMKPLQQRSELGNYGIARFASPLASVEGYMLNLNSNDAYQAFRTLREKLRSDNKPLSGYTLATTLDKYSERGQAYIDGLRAMISYNKLSPLDQAYLANNQVINLTIN